MSLQDVQVAEPLVDAVEHDERLALGGPRPFLLLHRHASGH